MMRVVKCRANEVVHGGVDDHKVLGLAVLYEQNTRHQNSGIADQETAGLEDQSTIEVAGRLLHDLGIGLRMRRRLIVVPVGNAEAAAEIDMRYGMSIAPQHAHEIGKQSEGIAEGIELSDLAADMHI